ncbi:MAG TPA: UDP-galactopyranose mutase [Clostridia bacterium]|nr:UDP-galactopyranose mutase [Clostridia bacterium]
MAYDWLIVGSGLFGAVFAHEAKKRGASVLVVERRTHAGGNVYCEEKEGIRLHAYGAHIFHTSDKEVWDYMNALSPFNHFVNSPVANFKGELYNLPFNMNTFYQMWGVKSPTEAKGKIEAQRGEAQGEPKNLEEQAIALVGRDIYEKLVKGYTEKQWGRTCDKLPAFIIKRLPVRYTFDNNYFSDPYQGIPKEGYNAVIKKLLAGCTVILNTDFNLQRGTFIRLCKRLLYTGSIDAFYDYRFGALAYRSLRFETERLDAENYQGVAAMNFTDADTPYTRVIEHKHFEFGTQPCTYVTREYPLEWELGAEAYYPVNDEENKSLYERYEKLAGAEKDVLFGGRLAKYAYLDMDKTVAAALALARKELT